MSRRLIVWLIALVCIFTVPAKTGWAQSAPGQTLPAQSYPAGWNLTAFPPGTVLPEGTPLYTLPSGASSYELVTPAQGTSGGLGYWAHFSAGANVILAAGASVAYSVAAAPGQWVMIGDPSGVLPATISGADTVYSYDSAGGYVAASLLNPGQGAWAFSGGGGTISVTPASAPSPQWGDSRFAVTLVGDLQQLVTLGARWFVSYTKGLGSLPAGAVWVQYVDLQSGAPIPDDIAQRVSQYPGSYWLIGNEPNVRASPQQLTGDQYARDLHDLIPRIKGVDPSAKIVGPNVINFDFTCLDCPGFTSGHDWTDSFLAAYQSDFGSLPPIDVWSIHTYPLDWDNFPQVNTSIVENQLSEFRQYLDGKPGLAGAPIWDTELGTHWGFQGIDWHDDGTGSVKAFPVGSFQTDALLGYMQSVLDWLSTNGPALHIDRWFFFATYESRPESWETVYGGINLLDGSGPDARLTDFGRLYRRLSGLSP